MDELTYNGRQFSEFNTFFDGSKAFGTPEKDYELVEIMGRNGSLSIYNDRFKDIALPFPCFIRTGFLTHFRDLTEFLNSQEGYLRLETSKEPNHFRMALFQGVVDPQTTAFNHGGQFTINFLAHPERWLKSGEQWATLTADGTITNPTLFKSKPIIRVYGAGQIGVGSETLTLTQAGNDYVDIDCDMMNAHEGATSMNQYLQVTDFPTLHPGSNGITLGTGVTKVEIQPRWFEV